MPTVQIMPSNWQDIYFETPSGEAYTGNLSIYARCNSTLTQWNFTVNFTILDGYIQNGRRYQTVNVSGQTWIISYTFDGGIQWHYKTSFWGPYKPFPNPFVVAPIVSANISLDIIIDEGILGPLTLDFKVDEVKQSSLSTSGVFSYSGNLTKYEIQVGGKVLVLNFPPDGTLSKNYTLGLRKRQVSMNSFLVEHDGQPKIMNDTGDEISRLELFSI